MIYQKQQLKKAKNITQSQTNHNCGQFFFPEFIIKPENPLVYTTKPQNRENNTHDKLSKKKHAMRNLEKIQNRDHSERD